MEDLLATVSPWLDKARDLIMWVAELISRNFDFPVDNVYTIILVLISLFVGKKLFNLFYSSSEGRNWIWIVISAIIFGILKFI